MGLEDVTRTLFSQLGIQCIRVPETSRCSFVLSDHPVAHYEPTPKTPESGAGFISSPNSQTWVPLDPRFGLLLSPQAPCQWDDVNATDNDIDELNLLTYAWAADTIYGSSQAAVTRVRRFAAQNPRLLGEFHYRPPRIWISRGSENAGGVHEFVSRRKGETVKRKMYVTDDGTANARPPAYVRPPEEMEDLSSDAPDAAPTVAESRG
jgi:hypothetical protein